MMTPSSRCVTDRLSSLPPSSAVALGAVPSRALGGSAVMGRDRGRADPRLSPVSRALYTKSWDPEYRQHRDIAIDG